MKASTASHFEPLELRRLLSAAPTIESLTIDPSTVGRGQIVTFTANNVVDSDGTIRAVTFVADVNGDGIANEGDRILGVDPFGANGYSKKVRVPRTAPAGNIQILAIATDKTGDSSAPAAATATITNAAPTIKALVAAPPSLYAGKRLNIIAVGGRDTDGKIAKVDFYRDTNGNSLIDPGVDELFHTDDSPAGGFKASPDTVGQDPGAVTVLAQATDNDGAVSNVVSTVITFKEAGVDLTILGADYLPKLLNNSTPTLKVAVRAKNAGLAASSAFSYQLRISANNIFGDSDDFIVITEQAPGLAGNQGRLDTKSIALADVNIDPPSGNYFVMIKIDANDEVAETNEANNIFISSTANLVIAAST
jgi:hypothetical protein